MSDNLYHRTHEQDLVTRIATLERQILELKSNQPPSKIGSKINVDQSTGTITIYDAASVPVLTLGYLGLDGSNNPMYGLTMSDGTNIRVLLGNQTNGF